MPTITKSALSSAELGILWMAYLNKSAISMFASRFAQRTQDKNAKSILVRYTRETQKLIDRIEDIFNREKAVLPMAFTNKDIFDDAPSLFDDIFHIMFMRVMMKIKLGFNSVHFGMSYREDVLDLFSSSLDLSEAIYSYCTDYLTDQGVMSKPPYITMPKEIEFIEEKKYMSGVNLFGNKRALNTLETAYLYQILEMNIFGMQLMAGFAQAAKEKEVKDYFTTGRELAKDIISKTSNLLLQSDIQPPSTWAGKATDSIVPPFSDKLMMYCTNIMASYSVGNTALGMSFSMRSDLPLKLAVIMKDTVDFAKEGGKIMIKHKWLEEPPQMEDRNLLSQR